MKNKEQKGIRSAERDSDNRVIISMRVNDDSDFLSPFSKSNTPVISESVADFLENSVNAVNPKEKLTLRIYGDCIDDSEKEIYSAALKEYFTDKNIANERSLKRNFIISLILLAFGISVLAFSIFIGYHFEGEIWSEVFDIVAWVLIWECVDIRLFKNNELKLNKLRYSAFADMKIEYYK